MSTPTIRRTTRVSWDDPEDSQPVDDGGVTFTPDSVLVTIESDDIMSPWVTLSRFNETTLRSHPVVYTPPPFPGPRLADLPTWACHYLDEAIVLAAGGDPR